MHSLGTVAVSMKASILIVSLSLAHRILDSLPGFGTDLGHFFQRTQAMATTALLGAATATATATATGPHAFASDCTARLRDALQKRNMVHEWTCLTPMPSTDAHSARFKWQSLDKMCWFSAHADGTYTLETTDNNRFTCKRLRSLLLHIEACLHPDEAVLLSSDSDSECASDDDGDGDVEMADAVAVDVRPFVLVRFQHDWLQNGPFYYQYERKSTFYGAMRPAPTMFPCMDDYDKQSRCGKAHMHMIDRHNLERGNCVLHMMRNGQPVLTLKRVVKNGCVMLGLFAAINLRNGSVIGLYLGPVVAKGQKCDPLAEDNGLDQDFLVRHFETFVSGNVQEDEILPKGEPVAPSRNAAFHLMHFINSCDSHVAQAGETKNCELCSGIGQVCLTEDIRKGTELLTTYGTDYWKEPQEPKSVASNECDCDSDYTE